MSAPSELDVLDAGDLGGAAYLKRRDDHCRAGAEVGCLDGSRCERSAALDDGESALDRDVSAHADELADILIAVVPDVLIYDAGARNAHEQRGELRLAVGGEAGVRHCLDIAALEGLDSSVDGKRLVVFGDLAAHLAELCGDGFQMLGCDVGDGHAAACRSRRAHICSRLDLVGDDGVADAVHVAYAAHLDNVGARAADIGAH